MSNTAISHGRDGNITALLSAAEKFHKIRESYKGVYREYRLQGLSMFRN
jgi:hypothetical protein